MNGPFSNPYCTLLILVSEWQLVSEVIVNKADSAMLSDNHIDGIVFKKRLYNKDTFCGTEWKFVKKGKISLTSTYKP